MARPFQRWGRTFLITTGTLAFIGGLFLFGWVQTQAMFRASEIQTGLAQRNDGGIFLAALIASLGLAAILAALSHQQARRRFLPAMGVALSATILLTFHFAFFVNGIMIPDASQLWVEASFLFQDTAGVPIGVFVLTLSTVLVIGLGVFSAMGLLTPTILRDRILHPSTLDEQRRRSVLLTLLLLLGGATFSIQFFRWAFEADAVPTGGFITTNVIALYYILSLLVAAAVAMATWRTWTLCWGELRLRSGPRFRRNHRNLVRLETWVWGTILLLTLIVMYSAPIYSVEAVALNQVFAANSHGFHMFFLLVPLVYLVQRLASRGLLRHLQTYRRTVPTIRFDSLLAMSLTVVAVWVATPLVLRGDEITPLVQIFVRTGLVTLVLLAFSLKLDPSADALLVPRNQGLPLMLFAVSSFAILTAITLWGAGNTVVTVYARDSGGFLTPESRFLQPYTVLLRIAGAAFLALPPILALWALTARTGRSIQPGHLLMIGIGTIIAVNLLFTIQATDPFDPLIGRSDVLIGLYLLQLTSTIDTVVFTGLWAFATLAALAAAVRILLTLNGTRVLPRNPRPAPREPR